MIVTPEIVNPIPAGAALPQIKYPKSFLTTASGIPMNTPEDEPAPSVAAEAIPIEKLQESMKPEQPLVIDPIGQASGGQSGGTGGTSATGATAAAGSAGATTP